MFIRNLFSRMKSNVRLYNRLVLNVKKVLPIAKEVNKIIIETYEYLETLPNKKAKDAHMKVVEESIKTRIYASNEEAFV